MTKSQPDDNVVFRELYRWFDVIKVLHEHFKDGNDVVYAGSMLFEDELTLKEHLDAIVIRGAR